MLKTDITNTTCTSPEAVERLAKSLAFVANRTGMTVEKCEEVTDKAAAMLRAMKGRVRVKPLKWVDLHKDGSRYDVTSDDPLGYSDSIHGLQDDTYHSRLGHFPTLEAAKAAAQADYEARILAALDPAPDQGDWDAALESAVKVAAGEVAAHGHAELAPFMRRAIRQLKKGPHHD